MSRSRSCPPGKISFDAKATGPPPPQTLDDVYFCARSVLSSLAGGLSSAECTSLVADMVCSAVHRAVADFAATWNDSAPVILAVLPSELLIDCLSYLPFHDKIAASHVSRGWRQFMLAAPTLWDTVDTSKASYTCPVDVFRVIVIRSGNVQLDVNLQSGWHPYADLDNWPSLLRQVSCRLRSLTISLPMPLQHTFDLFDDLYAPVLEVLRIDAKHAPQAIQFPSNGNALMPRLKHLALDRISIPHVYEPMPGLKSFEGHYYDSSDLCDLFAIFPCLVSVALRDLLTPVTLTGAALPSTLISATVSVRSEEVDTAVGILRAFTALPQCNVEVSMLRIPTSIMDTVGALAHTHAGPWRLAFQSVHRDSEVTVRRSSDNEFAVSLASRQLVFPDSIMTVVPETFSLSPFDRVEALTLSGAALGAAVFSGAQFPALRELFLVDEDYGQESMLRHAVANPDLAPMRLPALRAVTLTLRISWAHMPHECTVPHLHDFIATRLRYGAERLKQITIDHSLMNNGAQCLALVPDLNKLASRVLSVTAAGEEWLTSAPVVSEMEDDMPPVFSLIDD